MATRLYLESSGTDPLPGLTTWDATTFSNTTAWSPTHLPMNPLAARKSTTITNTTWASVAGGSAYSGWQFASPPLNGAQSVTGTISGIMKVFGISLNDNFAASVMVYSNTGTTQRGVCIHSTAATGVGTVWNTSTQQTSIIWNATAITTVAASDGDRLVFQFGGDTGAVAGSRKSQIGSAAASDYALTNALTTDLNPWIEFSANLNFKLGVSALMLVGCGL